MSGPAFHIDIREYMHALPRMDADLAATLAPEEDDALTVDTMRSWLPGSWIGDYIDLQRVGLPAVLNSKARSGVVLYLTAPKSGHYVSILHPSDDVVEVYDPLGIAPDNELHFVPRDEKVKLKEARPWLRDALRAWQSEGRGRSVDYNLHKVQVDSSKIATCGRHAITRVRNMDISNEPYSRALLRLRGDWKPDQVVTAYVSEQNKDLINEPRAAGGALAYVPPAITL